MKNPLVRPCCSPRFKVTLKVIWFSLLMGCFGALSTHAVNVTKLDTTSMAATVANWSAAPATTDIGEFGSTPSAGTLAAMTLGGNLTLAGIQLDNNMAGPLTIATGSTLTLGTAGTSINMSAANFDATINCALGLSTLAHTWNVASGRTLTLGSTVSFGSGGTLIMAGAGNFSLPATTLSTGNGTGNIGVTTTGNVTINDVNIGKTGSTTTTVPTAISPVNAGANTGFYVSGAGAVVNLNTLELSTQNGGCSALITAGSTTVKGTVINGRSNSGTRGTYFQVSGGSFTASDTTNGIVMSPNNGAIVNLSEFYVSGGTATLGKITFGAATDTVGGTGFVLVKGGTLYIGGGGIVRGTTIGAYNSTVSLFTGLLGAVTNWSTSHPIALSAGAGTNFTIQAADASGIARDITLSGVVSGAAGITKTGGGTLTLSGANTFTGTVTNSAGTLVAGVAEVANVTGPFGKQLANATGTIIFGGGTLQYSGANNNDYSGRFSTGGNQPIRIDTAGQSVSFGTALAGSGTSLTKIGNGTLSLTAANTYDGGTTNNGGTLIVNNASGSGTGSGVVVINSGLLGGNGIITGAVTVNSGGGLAPGASVGTNTVGSLTINAGATNNFEFNGTANDQTIVTVADGLVLNGGAFNLYQEGGTVAFTTPGTYRLIQYSGNLSGAATSGGNLDSTWTTASGSNPHVANPQANLTYQFGTSAGWITLTIVSTVNNGSWAVDTDGNWSQAGNWTALAGTMPPRNATDAATLGTGSALRTVTLDANETVGGLTINNANSFVIANAGNVLTLDNAGSGATVNVTAGTANDIQTTVALNDNVTATVGSGKSLGISGVISNTSTSKTLLVNGAGTLSLSGANTYGPAAGSVGTTLTGGGTLQVGNSSALGSGDLTVATSSTLKSGGGLNIGNNIAVASGNTATVDNSTTLTLSGIVSGGAVAKINTGTLNLTGANTYTGGTVISAGAVAVNADGVAAGNSGNLGAVPASATPNNIVLNGGDLLASTTVTLHANRGIGIGATTGAAATTALVDAASGQTLTVNGVIASAGNSGVNNLTLNSGTGNNGTIILGAANTFSGTTVVSNGTLQLAHSLALQNSILDYSVGNLSFGSLTAATIGQLIGSQNVVLTNQAGAGVTLTIGGNAASWTYAASLSGNGSLSKVGGGTLTLTGSNTYTNTTSVSAGVLEIGTGGSVNGGPANVVAGTLRVNGGTLNASSGNISGSLQVANGTATYTGALTGASGYSFNLTGGSLTAASLSVPRGGTTYNAQPNGGDTANNIYINGGSLNITGNVTLTTDQSSANMRIDSGSVTVGGALTIGLDNSGRWSLVDVNGGTLTANDAVTGISIGGATAGPAELLLRGTGTATAQKISFGQAANAGAAVLNMIGTSSLYVGSGGLVKVGSAITPTITLGGTAKLGAAADWSSSMNLTLSGGSIQTADAANAPHNISLSGVLSGSGALTKTGTGTLVLSGANTYTGGTVVSAGTLSIRNTTGSGTGTGSILLQSGSTLTGNGIISGAVTNATGAILQPGLGGVDTSSLTVNSNLTLEGTTLIALNRTNVQTAAKITGVNILAGSGALVVTNVGPDLQAGDTFTLFNAAIYNASFVSTNLPVLPAGLTWNTGALVSGGTISVVSQGPNITAGPTNQTVQCGGSASFEVAATGSGSLSYQWSTNAVPVTGATNASFLLLNISLQGPITVSVAVMDAFNNTATSNATVTVIDTVAPVITLNGSTPMTVECHGSFSDPGATAVDGCAGNVSVTVTGSVNANSPGSYVLTYTADDGNGNTNQTTRTVNVTDTLAPVITYHFTNLVLSANGTCEAIMPDVTGTNYIIAADACSGSVTITQTPTNSSVLTLGTNTVVLAVADSGNNISYSTNTIVVADTAAPLVNLLGANPITVECHGTFVDPGATASDSCSGIATLVTNGVVNANSPGAYTISYVATDAAGNSVTNTRTVNVTDTTAPTVTVLGANPVTNYVNVAFVDPGATASDLCSGALAVTTNGTVDVTTPGTYLLSYVASDAGGNSATNTRTVVILALQTPVITSQEKVNGEFRVTFTGPSGQPFTLLSSQNIATPLTSWTSVVTGNFNGSPVTYTNIAPTDAKLFYIIRSP